MIVWGSEGVTSLGNNTLGDLHTELVGVEGTLGDTTADTGVNIASGA